MNGMLNERTSSSKFSASRPPEGEHSCRFPLYKKRRPRYIPSIK
jgi:hypothetical protein